MKYEILNKRIRGNTPEHILAQMFRDICVQGNLVCQMESLVLNRVHYLNNLDKSKRRRRGPIDSEILSDRMSWGVFVTLIKDVLLFDDFEFTAKVRLNNFNIITTHKPNVTRTLMKRGEGDEKNTEP